MSLVFANWKLQKLTYAKALSHTNQVNCNNCTNCYCNYCWQLPWLMWGKMFVHITSTKTASWDTDSWMLQECGLMSFIKWKLNKSVFQESSIIKTEFYIGHLGLGSSKEIIDFILVMSVDLFRHSLTINLQISKPNIVRICMAAWTPALPFILDNWASFDLCTCALPCFPFPSCSIDRLPQTIE